VTSVEAGQLTGPAASRNVHGRGLETLLKAVFVCRASGMSQGMVSSAGRGNCPWHIRLDPD